MRIDEAILIMENERPHCGDKLTFTEEERYEAYTWAIGALKELSSADRPKGEWDYSDDMYETRVCSVCGFDTEDYKEYNFCPNCGADMRGESDD